jgi:hypothetical protein
VRRRIEGRPLAEESLRRDREEPVMLETAGEKDELLVLRVRDDVLILNEREAWTLEQYIRIWRGAL